MTSAINALDLEPHAWILALYDQDGFLIAQLPEAPGLIGKTNAEPRLRDRSSTHEMVVFHGPAFGLTEPYAWALKQSHNLPLIAVAGYSLSVALSPWHQDLFIHSLVGLAALLGSVLTIWLLRRQRITDTSISEAAKFKELLLAASPVGILAFRANDGHCALVNDAAANMAGLAEERLRIDDYRQWPSWRQAGLIDAARRVLAEQNSWSGECRFQSPSGPDLWLMIRLSAFASANQPHLLVVATDITHIRQTTEETQKLVKRLQLAVDSVHLGIWEWSVASGRLLWDDGMFHLYGVDQQAFTSGYRDWAERLLPEDLPIAESLLQKAVDGEADFDTTFRIRLPTGEIRFIRGTALVVRDDAGKPSYLIGINWDITANEQAKQALVEAKDAAEAATRAKAEFLAVMSHEIRTPLNGVLGLANMLLDSKLDLNQRDVVQMLHTCGDGLLVLINDILDFSKIEAGKLELENEAFDLFHTVDDAVTLIAERVTAKGLELTTVIGKDIPDQLCGDQTRLRQVLVNLLSNAIKFTERGTISIRVERQPAQADDAINTIRLAFSITDTGIGMTQKAQDRLFQAFSQAEFSTTRRFGGTGLGLVISKRLVECMGGSISVRSQAGAGSTFSFTACLHTSDSTIPATSLSGLRLLIAVRASVLRDSLIQQCQHWNVSPVIVTPNDLVSTLRGALAIGKSFQALLIDAGTTVDDELRAVTGDIHAPICRILDLSGSREIQADIVLARPTRIGQLRQHLREIITGTPILTAHDTTLVKFRGHVLVAEDNPVNQRVAVSLLGKFGITCDLAADGREVLTALARRAYDLVLMDCQMPEMDGLSATKAIRELEVVGGGRHRLPIIALTAGVTNEERHATQAAGMDAFLTKPIRRNELEDVLARWLPTRDDSGSFAPVEPLADIRALRRLQEDTDDVQEFLGLFAEEGRKCLRLIATAIEQSSVSAITAAAHRIKGTALLVGAKRFASEMMRLEHCGKTGDLATCAQISARLEALLAESVTDLRRETIKMLVPPTDAKPIHAADQQS